MKREFCFAQADMLCFYAEQVYIRKTAVYIKSQPPFVFLNAASIDSNLHLGYNLVTAEKQNRD